jgi:hypothetical protein
VLIAKGIVYNHPYRKEGSGMAARRREDMNLDPDSDGDTDFTDMTAEEGWSRLDRQARDCLGISAAEFLHRWLHGRLRMTMLEGPEYVPWHRRPVMLRETNLADIDDELSEDFEISAAEFDDMFDHLARTELGISGKEFIRKFNAGEYPDWDPELTNLVMLMPYFSEQPD